MQMKQAVFLML